MIKLIEKIEGEATLDFKIKDAKIDFVDISFTSTRNIEKILEQKPALDALVINPRVCGICGHAHLIATVGALESCYEEIQLSNKAKIIRELTLTFELIQNHFKWFYLTLFPLLGYKQEVLKAAHATQLMGKAIATFGGQYPHTSYAIVGGVTCEITQMDILQIQRYIEETIVFFQKNILDLESEEFVYSTQVESILQHKGDLSLILEKLKKEKLHEYGKSYDRFIVFGSNSSFHSGKSNRTRFSENLDFRYVQESEQAGSYAKNVSYKENYYEVGPLARAIVMKKSLIMDAHRRYGDSIFSRILARVLETVDLLLYTKELLSQIDLEEPSYIKPHKEIAQLSAQGVYAVEAARGTLIHKVKLQEGIIQNYEIITPTQWNLAGGTREKMGIAQKAMFGLESMENAELVFKSFDVCSVCTTH